MTAGDTAGQAGDTAARTAAVGPVAAFLALPLGSRVVVRHRVGDVATDALGVLLRRTAVDCEIRTRNGDVTVRLVDVVAAKEVPPPPSRRRPRST